MTAKPAHEDKEKQACEQEIRQAEKALEQAFPA
jgi:hypothetical protein